MKPRFWQQNNMAKALGWNYFFKIEDNGTAPLLIIYQWTLRATLFLLLHLPQVAGWLWTKPQADTPKQKIIELLMKENGLCCGSF
jgi:hypothetical protein